jgi:hypothetical protein
LMSTSHFRRVGRSQAPSSLFFARPSRNFKRNPSGARVLCRVRLSDR